MKKKIKEENKLVFRYSELKLVFLTVLLLFFVIFPIFLPSRITFNQNLFFIIALLVVWLLSAIIYLFAHLSRKASAFSVLRYATTVTDIIFLSSLLFILGTVNSNYFFLFAFIIIGASFYQDVALVICAGSLSILVITISFFIESKFPLPASDYFISATRILFLAITTYFVYLFILSYKAILSQKSKIKKFSVLNQQMLVNFSQQLRAPLPVIRDFLEVLFLEKAGSLNAKQKKILAILHSNTKKLIEDSSSLVSYNQLRTGELYLDPKDYDLKEIVEAAVRRDVDESLSREIKVAYTASRLKINVNVDQTKFFNALCLFFSQVILAAKKRSKIKISCQKTKFSHFAQIKISYFGETLPDPKKLKENNLDLYVTNKIIALHHGDLTLTSKGEKQLIVIILPSQD